MAELMLCVAASGIIGLIAILIFWRDEEPKKAPTAHEAYMLEWNRANIEWAQPTRKRTKRLAPRHGGKRLAGKQAPDEGWAPLPMEWW